MKKVRLWATGIVLVCAAVYLGDFVMNGSHPFSDLGAAISFLIVSAVLIVASVRER